MKKIFGRSSWDKGVLGIFAFFAALMLILGIVYLTGLHPSAEKVSDIIKKFSVNGYTIPNHVAERYLTWFHMRTYFFILNYSLTLLGIVASLMTVFYASTDAAPVQSAQSTPPSQPAQSTPPSSTQSTQSTQTTQVVQDAQSMQTAQLELNTRSIIIQKRRNTIIFLSLVSLCFSLSNFFINAGSKANMAQHAWRELDICISETIHNLELSENEKNKVIVNTVAEMERYIESFEH